MPALVRSVAIGKGAIRAVNRCFPRSYEICGNALDDNCSGVLEEGCGFESGRVQFMIAWADNGADVDLHVVDPGGELIEEGQPSVGGLAKPRDCPGRNGECEGVNVENVYLDDTLPLSPGLYRVSVRLDSLGDAESPVWINLSMRLGAEVTSYEVRLSKEEPEVSLQLQL